MNAETYSFSVALVKHSPIHGQDMTSITTKVMAKHGEFTELRVSFQRESNKEAVKKATTEGSRPWALASVFFL